MKNLLLSCCLALGAQFVHAHGDESKVALEPEIIQSQAGKITYQFQLVNTEKSSLITEADLQISHEKKIHLLVYDPSLKEFQHVHPVFKNNLWSVELDFSVNGIYWVWAQGKLVADGSKPQIEPYLGAFAHVVAVPEDGDSLLHVHPMNGAKPNEGMIHATFPQAGSYRLWIQYIDGGVLNTIPLSIKVF